LLLGNYQTTARQLLAMVGKQPERSVDVAAGGSPGNAKVEWDPDRGTFLRR
jgi:hypothetical protein